MMNAANAKHSDTLTEAVALVGYCVNRHKTTNTSNSIHQREHFVYSFIAARYK